jgi:NADP-dependent 3-hydroxy acid dehydrogenase YdfG
LNEIKNKFQNIDICFFSTGTWNPKKEKDIDVEQIEDVFKVNFFGTLNSIKAVEEYFKNKKKVLLLLFHLLQDIEDYQIQLVMDLQNLLK